MKVISPSLAAALSLTLVNAMALPTPTDEAKVGVVIDNAITVTSGLGQKPLPLPPGHWRVVVRQDYKLGISSRAEYGSPDMPMVGLTLLNEEASSPVAVVIIDYPTDRAWLRWTNMPCADPKAQSSEDFGTTTGSLKYACVNVYSHAGQDFKKLVGLTNLPPEFMKRVGPLAQYANSLPVGYNWTSISTSIDRGRRVTATVITRALPGEIQGQVSATTQAYAKNVGQALLNWVSNEEGIIAPFPNQ